MNTTTISVLYQDHSLLIINKPAGVVIHPTYKHVDGDTLWDALLLYLQQHPPEPWQAPDLPDEPEWQGAPDEKKVLLRERRAAFLQKRLSILPRPCLLHRLDKDTSGVVALARTESARRHIIPQFHAHTIQKRYLALAQPLAPTWATPRVPLRFMRQSATGDSLVQQQAVLETLRAEETLLLDGPLQRDPAERRRSIVGPDGQSSRTQVRLLGRERDWLLLEVQPVTGRTHQIRAHLAAAGYSLLGDQMYAPVPEAETEAAALTRQFLHAASLTLRTYPDNQERTFSAPLAPDLVLWLATYTPSLLALITEKTSSSVCQS